MKNNIGETLLILGRFGVLCLALGCSNQPPLDTRIRCNGVYRSTEPTDEVRDGRQVWQYLRFYSDGLVIVTPSVGEPEDLQKWFSRERPETPTGRVTVDGDNLSFTAVNVERGTVRRRKVDYNGQILKDGLELDWYSHVTKRGGKVSYTFVAWGP